MPKYVNLANIVYVKSTVHACEADPVDLKTDYEHHLHSSGALHVHHIETKGMGAGSQDDSLENLAHLCVWHHDMYHRKYTSRQQRASLKARVRANRPREWWDGEAA